MLCQLSMIIECCNQILTYKSISSQWAYDDGTLKDKSIEGVRSCKSYFFASIKCLINSVVFVLSLGN